MCRAGPTLGKASRGHERTHRGTCKIILKLDRAKGVRPGIVDALEEQLLRELASGGQLTAEDLAYRVHARQWVDLSTALAQLTARGHVTVVGPLGRAETRYRAHPQGLAALVRLR